MKKTCSRCSKTFKGDEVEKNFSKNRSKKDGLRSNCKACQSVYYKQWRENNKEKKKEYQKQWCENNKEHTREYYKQWRENNKEERKEYNKQWREDNKEERKEYQKQWRENNKEHTREYNREYQRERHANNPLVRLKQNIRNRVRAYLKGDSKSQSTFEIVGCSGEFLMEHLKAKFKDGMTWDNYGPEWHVDHIIPLASAENEEEVFKLNHYTNLQPLWGEENLSKGKKLDWKAEN